MNDVTFPDVDTLRRRGTVKWTAYPADVLPLWVAETDAVTCPAVLTAVREAVDREYLGYPSQDTSALQNATAQWYQQRYGWQPNAEHIFPVADVVRGVVLAVKYLTAPGSAVVVPTPAYMPFFEVGPTAERDTLFVPTVQTADYTGPDLDALETHFKNGAGSVILSAPNNPLGFTYAPEVLRRLTDLAAQYNARVISDEIHAPVVLHGKHVPTASVSETAAAVTITVTATSKGWNTAGLKCAQLILNDDDATTWQKLPHAAREGMSTLGLVAATAAYTHGEAWLDNFLDSLRTNQETLARRLPEVAPGAKFTPNAASFLAWLDLRGVDAIAQSGVEPQQWLLDNARVAVNPGLAFGDEGAGHVRLNFATSPSILNDALDRIGNAIAAAN
ncbi:MalY/PatB family protein [Corynebacterium sp. H113]|uniref:MalY/PatB family protein n=1 Tax=Corynebacterium sp. H113 TaxID=3133419 RepID=UPI0030A072A1